jgi:hypothetical protein
MSLRIELAKKLGRWTADRRPGGIGGMRVERREPRGRVASNAQLRV